MIKTIITLIAIALVGCTIVKEGEPLKFDLPNDTQHKYYVIDVNSDIPDAYFETYKEASVYQKEFAENHEYVIVKINRGYKVYNMVNIKSK